MFIIFQGFGDRLLSEIKKLAPKNMKLKVRILNINIFKHFYFILFFVKYNK